MSLSVKTIFASKHLIYIAALKLTLYVFPLFFSVGVLASFPPFCMALCYSILCMPPGWLEWLPESQRSDVSFIFTSNFPMFFTFFTETSFLFPGTWKNTKHHDFLYFVVLLFKTLDFSQWKNWLKILLLYEYEYFKFISC